MSPHVWIPLAFAWLLGSLLLTVALALAARFALAPVLDAAARLRHGPAAPHPEPERGVGRSA